MSIISGDFKVKIYYEDTDFSGYVYHANYFKFLERARSELFGIEFIKKLYSEEKSHFVLAKLDSKFIKPAVFGDEIIIKTEVEYRLGSPLVLCKQQCLSNCDKIMTANVTLCLVGIEGRPQNITDNIIQKFNYKGLLK